LKLSFTRRSAFEILMATVTTPPSPAGGALAASAPAEAMRSAGFAPVTVCIEPPHGLLELRLGELWEYRELLYFFVWRDVKVRYKQTVIGVAWVILQPLMTMGVFTIFFGRLAKLPSEACRIRFSICGAGAVDVLRASAAKLHNDRGGESTRDHQGVFPRLVLPLAAVCSGLLDFVIGFAVMIILTLSFGIHPPATVVLLPVFLLLAVATALGVGCGLRR